MWSGSCVVAGIGEAATESSLTSLSSIQQAARARQPRALPGLSLDGWTLTSCAAGESLFSGRTARPVDTEQDLCCLATGVYFSRFIPPSSLRLETLTTSWSAPLRDKQQQLPSATAKNSHLGLYLGYEFVILLFFARLGSVVNPAVLYCEDLVASGASSGRVSLTGAKPDRSHARETLASTLVQGVHPPSMSLRTAASHSSGSIDLLNTAAMYASNLSILQET
jgi:hypothetical protein